MTGNERGDPTALITLTMPVMNPATTKPKKRKAKTNIAAKRRMNLPRMRGHWLRGGGYGSVLRPPRRPIRPQESGAAIDRGCGPLAH